MREIEFSMFAQNIEGPMVSLSVTNQCLRDISVLVALVAVLFMRIVRGQEILQDYILKLSW